MQSKNCTVRRLLGNCGLERMIHNNVNKKQNIATEFKKLTLEEKEIDILRNPIDIAEKRKGLKITSDPDVKKIISILEDFLKKKKLNWLIRCLLQLI